MSVYTSLATRIRKNLPVALATIIEGPHTGACMIVRPHDDKETPENSKQAAPEYATMALKGSQRQKISSTRRQ